jgi:hypothetical protein
MKKFAAILCVVVLVALAATSVFCLRNSGEFYGDSSNQVLRYSPNFAPGAGSTKVTLGTKSVTTIAVDSLAAYKFFFTKVSDNTSVVGKVFFGTVATWGAAGGIPTSGEGPWHPGKNLKTVTFAPISSATPVQVTIYKQ